MDDTWVVKLGAGYLDADGLPGPLHQAERHDQPDTAWATAALTGGAALTLTEAILCEWRRSVALFYVHCLPHEDRPCEPC